MERRKIFLIEGTDYSGKETQTTLLFERLTAERIPCETMSFPRYNTPTGRIVGQCYLGKEDLKEKLGWQGDVAWFGENAELVDSLVASYYYAADRRFALPEINKILFGGENLIFNRYVESNMGHQGGKLIGLERAKTIEKIEKLEYDISELPRPDLTIFLFMPYQVAAELKKVRRGIPDIHESNQRHLINAEQTYLGLADKYSWSKIDCAPDGTINSLRTAEDIHEEVYQCIMKTLPKI